VLQVVYVPGAFRSVHVVACDGACVCRKELRRGRLIADLFAFNANNECERTYSLNWCRESAGVNAFAFFFGVRTFLNQLPFPDFGACVSQATK